MMGQKFWGLKCEMKLVWGFALYMWRVKAEKDAILSPSQYLKATSSMSFDYCMTAWIWPCIYQKTKINRTEVDQFNLACV